MANVLQPFLSIIIPAHNEEQRLPASLEQIFAFLQTQAYSSEVLVVENGSSDRTLEIAQSYSRRFLQLKVLQCDQRGKGVAVRQGMLTACGEYRFMCDADLSMPIEQLANFLPPRLTNFDLAIASREAAGAVRYNEPPYRHWGGRAINLMVRLLLLPGLHDTQCGFKCFRAEVAKDLFALQTLPGWSFDLEILYLARRRGYRLVEVPIHWYHSPESKLSVWRDAFQMMVDIFTIRRNARRGLYERLP